MKRLVALWMAVMMMGVSFARAESPTFNPRGEEAWYQAMLQDAQVSLGSNLRLKKVIERARAGEEITIAAIGGSITEGAGAKRPAECYVSRFAEGFRARYGADGGANVHLINAGVGGTPSTFGIMRYERDILAHVKDADNLPDLIIVEFAVNDGGEPTKHQCYESLVKELLELPNQPAVILLFAVFWGGWNLQDELRRVGETYDLMMVSIRDSAYPHVGQEWTKAEFFSDDYHPTSLGHGVMADCLLASVDAAAAAPDSAADVRLDAEPAFGTAYMGLTRIFGDTEGLEQYSFDRGGFLHDDKQAYKTPSLGRVCGPNFAHRGEDGAAPLTFTATFSKLLIAWRSVKGETYGRAQIRVDGKVVAIVGGKNDSWGQSEVTLAYDGKVPVEHTVTIQPTTATEQKAFTVTGIAFSTAEN